MQNSTNNIFLWCNAYIADTKPPKPAIKSSTLPRTSSQGEHLTPLIIYITAKRTFKLCLHSQREIGWSQHPLRSPQVCLLRSMTTVVIYIETCNWLLKCTINCEVCKRRQRICERRLGIWDACPRLKHTLSEKVLEILSSRSELCFWLVANRFGKQVSHLNLLIIF